MRKVFLLFSFFLATPSLLLFSLLLLSSHDHQTSAVLGISTSQIQQVAYAALPTDQNTFASSATFSDNRVAILQDFFVRHNSPLAPYAQVIVNEADTYGIDFRLLPAIAEQESGLCHRVPPSATYNCWGWGITSKKTLAFESYEDAITTITKYLAKWNLKTPEEIGKRYNPTNTNNWSGNVTAFMDAL